MMYYIFRSIQNYLYKNHHSCLTSAEEDGSLGCLLSGALCPHAKESLMSVPSYAKASVEVARMFLRLKCQYRSYVFVYFSGISISRIRPKLGGLMK